MERKERTGLIRRGNAGIIRMPYVFLLFQMMVPSVTFAQTIHTSRARKHPTKPLTGSELASALNKKSPISCNDRSQWLLNAVWEPASSQINITFQRKNKDGTLGPLSTGDVIISYGPSLEDPHRASLTIFNMGSPRRGIGMLSTLFQTIGPLVPKGSYLNIIDIRNATTSEIAHRWNGRFEILKRRNLNRHTTKPWDDFAKWLGSSDKSAHVFLESLANWRGTPVSNASEAIACSRADGTISQFVQQFFTHQGNGPAHGGFHLVLGGLYAGDLYFQKDKDLSRLKGGIELRHKLLDSLKANKSKGSLPPYGQLFNIGTLEKIGYRGLAEDRNHAIASTQ